ncbi:MAG: autotransporter-associated beta strand repeat-containing protein, partial [Verrucomicrobiota bacterium]
VTAYAAYTTGDLGTTGVSANNFKPTAAQTNVTASKTINSLNLTLQSGIAEGVIINSGQTLTLGAGSLINNGGGNISGGYLSTSGNAELIANYATSGTITSIISGSSGGLTKLGAGNLTLGSRDWYTGQTTVDQGTLTLAGGNNTLAANQPLVVNKSATLDLGANNQYVGSIVTPGTVENSGGSIIGSGVLTTNAANGTFGGSIGGSVSLVKEANNSGLVLTLVSANSTSGAVSVLGETLSLKDGGTLSGTSAIKVNNATLTLDNTGFANNINRINDSTPITLTGAVFQFNGAPSVASTETIGAVTLASGASRFNINPYVTTNSAIAGGADLTISSLTQTAGSAATVYFNPMGPSNNGAYGQAGLANPRINITTAPTLTNNIIGPWAVVMQTGNNNNGFNGFASYIPYTTVNGVTTGGLGSLGDTGYAAYNSTAAMTNVNQPTWNVKNSGTITGTNTIYSLTDGIPVFSTATDMVNLVSGGWIIGAGGQAIGAALDSGRITAGGSNTVGINDLYLYNYTNSRTLNSRIVDNPSNGSVRLILTTGDGNVMTMVNNLNSYTGGTVVNWTATTLAATAAGSNTNGVNVIPAGGLTINNSTVTETVSAGQINPTNVVTLNGGAGLTLFGTETLGGLVFNSNGGANTPTVSLAANSTLTLNGDITVTPTNVAVTPIIKPTSGTANLDFSGASRNITVTALAEGNSFQNGNNWSAAKGLTISSVIQNGALTVKGGGVLELSGANTFAGQLTVEAGALCVGSVNNVSANGVLGNSASAVILGKTAGQTGTLEYTGSSTSSSKPFTMATGGTGAFQVDTAGQTLTLTGLIDGSGALAKTGPGNLTLNGANTYSGDTTIKGGTLALGATGSIANSPNITVGDAGSTAAVLDVSAVSGGLTVGSTQTLKGIGTINGAVNVTGVLAPGAGVGTLSSGSLSFLNSSTYQYEMNSSVATSVGADLQIVNGALSLAGTVNLSLSNLGAGTFAAGTVFSLFNYTTGSGLWNSGLFTYNSTTLAEDATFSFAGKTWTIDYDATTKGANVAAATNGRYINITAATPTDPYSIWASGTFAHTLSDQAAGSDPDGDGLTNLQEFAFGTDPTVSSSAAIVYDATSVTTPGIPKMIEDGGMYYAVFGRRADYQTAGITYTVEFSADLSSGNWTASAVGLSELTTTGTIHAVKVPFPGLINSASGAQKARFFRVGVSQP